MDAELIVPIIALTVAVVLAAGTFLGIIPPPF